MNEKLETIVRDARLVHASEHLIYPMIDAMISDRVQLAAGRFRSGERDFVSDVAYIVGLNDLKDTLKKIQLQGNKAIEKIQGQN